MGYEDIGWWGYGDIWIWGYEDMKMSSLSFVKGLFRKFIAEDCCICQLLGIFVHVDWLLLSDVREYYYCMLMEDIIIVQY